LGSGWSHGPQAPAGAYASAGAGTAPSCSSAIVAPWSASTTLPQTLLTTRPGCSVTDTHSANGSASASSHAISVTATPAAVGGVLNAPPAGSVDDRTCVSR